VEEVRELCLHGEFVVDEEVKTPTLAAKNAARVGHPFDLTSSGAAVRFLATVVFVLCYLHCRSERASLPLGEDRETGENPALPRNCKRGNGSRPLGEIPGRPRA
jgi:hypothetical protein